MTKIKNVDMCNAPLLPNILAFAIPLALSNVLQLLYNAVDVIVVGNFAGSTATAAVTSTGGITNLIVCIMAGLSIGAMSIASQYCGAQDHEKLHRSVHTAIFLGLFCGALISIVGVVLSKPLLLWMKTPEDVLEQAILYTRIYFLGVPGMTMYNFGAAILRAAGDSKKTSLILALSGLVNVILNLIFVIFFRLDVAGVAIATLVSQYLSGILVVLCLLREQGGLRLIPSKLHFYREELVEIVRIGLPSGLLGSSFAIANILVQSSINSFGSTVVAGSGIAENLVNFSNTTMTAFGATALAFSGQNLGAHKPKRVTQTLYYCLFIAMAIGGLLAGLFLLLGKPLVSIYSNDEAVVAVGVYRLNCMLPFLFVMGAIEVSAGQLRGIGSSLTYALSSLAFGVILRIVYVATIFRWFPQLNVLYFALPVTWIATALSLYICCLVIRPRVFRRMGISKGSP